jgi:hypothetical protein
MGRRSRHPAKVRQRGAPGRIVQAPAQTSGACTRRPPKRRGEGPPMNWNVLPVSGFGEEVRMFLGSLNRKIFCAAIIEYVIWPMR